MIKSKNRYCILTNGSTIVELTQGQWMILDTHVWEQREDIRAIKWYAAWVKTGKKFYVLGNIYNPETKKRKSVNLHRIITNTTEPKIFVDHVNWDGLDNRLINLKPGSPKDNQSNRKAHREGKLLYAIFHKRQNVWQSQITFNKKQYHLGYFDGPRDNKQSEYYAHLRGVIGESFLYPPYGSPVDFEGFLAWRSTVIKKL